MEFGLLSALTGNRTYLAKADAAAKALYDRRSGLGLVGRDMHLDSGAWTSPEATIGPGVDSYYEYLLKVGEGGCFGVGRGAGGGVEGGHKLEQGAVHISARATLCQHCCCCMGMALGVVLQSLSPADGCCPCLLAAACRPT